MHLFLRLNGVNKENLFKAGYLDLWWDGVGQFVKWVLWFKENEQGSVFLFM